MRITIDLQGAQGENRQRGIGKYSLNIALGLARLRGMECRAPYAEAFHCAKVLIGPSD